MKLSSLSEIMQIGDSLFSASSFGRDHSELEISRKDDGDAYSKMQYLQCKCTYLFCVGWLVNVQRFITRAEPLYDSLIEPFVLRHFRCRHGLYMVPAMWSIKSHHIDMSVFCFASLFTI